MSYTTVERVRTYLIASSPVADRITDLPVTLIDNLPIRFWGCALAAGTLDVKSPRSALPVRQAVLVAENGVLLSSSPIIRGSVVAASDSSLGTVYTENLDYVVDYETATLHRKSGGALTMGQSIVVWYAPMHRYAAGEDSAIDHERAEIRRMSGGEIASGETVYLDFSPVFSGYDDALLASAVNDANRLIEREVDPEAQFGADEGLSSAATFKALEIISLSAASRELSNGRGVDRVALAWLKLAESFRERALHLLGSFKAPLTGPSAPTHS